MEIEKLNTPRLKLRKVTPEVYEYILHHFSKEELMSFFGFTSHEQLNKERERFDKGMTTFNKSFLLFHLIDKENEKNIGWCGFHTWYVDHKRAEIGYVLTDKNFRDKGLMSEAIASIVEYGFTKMNLHRIEAFVGEDNVPSLKLMKKMKFVKEGVLREHYLINEKMEDSIVYSLLKKDYKNEISK